MSKRAVILLALLLPACNRHKKVEVAATVEEAPRLASSLLMGDPKAAPRLLGGFHSIENDAWRWTERKFAVSLGRPPGSSQKGATLVLKLTVPPVSIERLHSLTLAASVQGTSLPSETYDKPGDYTYQRPIPANLLATDPVRVEFQLDKAIPPTGGDLRELGVVVLSVGLETR